MNQTDKLYAIDCIRRWLNLEERDQYCPFSKIGLDKCRTFCNVMFKYVVVYNVVNYDNKDFSVTTSDCPCKRYGDFAVAKMAKIILKILEDSKYEET